MAILQEYFDANEPKSRKKVFLDGNKIGNFDGNNLIINEFKDLECIYISNLPNLTKLIIKDCEKLINLELHLEKEVEVILVGDIRLKNVKTNNITKPTIIYQEKPKEGFCVRCFFDGSVIIALVILTTIIVYLSRKINEMREFIKALQKRLKLK